MWVTASWSGFLQRLMWLLWDLGSLELLFNLWPFASLCLLWVHCTCAGVCEQDTAEKKATLSFYLYQVMCEMWALRSGLCPNLPTGDAATSIKNRLLYEPVNPHSSFTLMIYYPFCALSDPHLQKINLNTVLNHLCSNAMSISVWAVLNSFTEYFSICYTRLYWFQYILYYILYWNLYYS